MTGGRIPDGDILFRHCVYPLCFTSRKFAHEKLMKLYDEPDGSILASLAWMRYVPTVELVHDYGCRLAFRLNEKKRTLGKFTEKSRHVYCGAYELTCASIRALATTGEIEEILYADAVHHVENGELAHTDLRISLKPRTGVDIEGTKTAILDRLWNACAGPVKHICDEDADMLDHPSTTLANAPRSSYL